MPTHGIAGELAIGAATTMETTCEDASMDLIREIAEARPFDVGAVERVLGARSLNLTASGKNQATTDGHLYAAWNGDVSVALTFNPLGTPGPSYSCDVVVTSYQLRNSSTDKATYSITVQSDGAISRAT